MNILYYKKIADDGSLCYLFTYDFQPIITDSLMVEITEEEYNILLAEIEAENQPEEPDIDEISDTEALNIILGSEI